MNIEELQHSREHIFLAWYHGMIGKENAQYLIHWLNGAIEVLAVKHKQICHDKWFIYRNEKTGNTYRVERNGANYTVTERDTQGKYVTHLGAYPYDFSMQRVLDMDAKFHGWQCCGEQEAVGRVKQGEAQRHRPGDDCGCCPECNSLKK